MPKGKYLFTSESVSMGHPDKVADQISDAVLDAILAEDPRGRVACETMVTTGLVMLAGEITTKAQIDFQKVVRQTIREIGYTDPAIGFDAESCAVLTAIGKQSPDIAMGVDEKSDKAQGAGDQGLMFGLAVRETKELMPLPIGLAHKICGRLADARQSGELGWLRPDGKSQVTIEYHDGIPVRAHTVVVSTQHTDKVDNATIRKSVIEKVIRHVVPPELLDDKTIYHVNPTGRFVEGGPKADCGLTGRKIIVDSYGGAGHHGGGAFSGKDPSKVDRSACYMARYVAKNVVAADLADKCEVQIAYAIGVAEPVSVHVHTFGTGKVEDEKLESSIRKVFDLTPRGIIKTLDLLRPIYRKTAYHGHFGRELPEFTWEKTDKVDALRRTIGVEAGVAR